jgi:3-oxoacyl-[acyl-carrier-protein] synthase-1
MSPRPQPLAITAHTLVTGLGHGLAVHAAALREGRSGLAPQRFETAALDTWLGVAPGLDDAALTDAFAGEQARADCRNNRLAEATLRADGFSERVQAAAARWGAHRVGVFLGTSTSGILASEIAYRGRDPATGALPEWLDYAATHNTHSVARHVRHRLELRGPANVVSTACSSSAKVYGNAARLIAAGVIDAAVVGGVDSLCMTTLYGFNSLELLSPEVCRPYDATRRGLSLGEGGALALLEREPDPAQGAPAGWLLGIGESSDGHHMSSPHPEGAGAAAAMRAALAMAGLGPEAVDYLNLHGTATPGNDAAEDRAVGSVFGTRVPCSSTKGHTGHTLGAAGGVEASLCLLALAAGWIPGGLHRQAPDPALHANYVDSGCAAALRVVASNSFGFGGSNACLVFGRAA